MAYEISNVISEINKAATELLQHFSSLTEGQINTVPYPGSWTAAQLVRHVVKSTSGMASVMLKPSKPADRDPTEKIDGFKTTFLDFTTKMQSPEFIIPEDKVYDKEASIRELTDCFKQLTTSAGQANLTELVEGLPMGDVTKLELLHFALYHTQRHLHQMKKIQNALS